MLTKIKNTNVMLLVLFNIFSCDPERFCNYEGEHSVRCSSCAQVINANCPYGTAQHDPSCFYYPKEEECPK
ncbi:hypothetical protein [Flammeovirga aprica]|uniref:Uncharacterized protein n=1 Tax=Flammeovirga aprica JL-4 TaxID=694437 RepID=A0A7X9XCJ4_9BACT|nr:hypothetical protein [Flammeovirga aprica]NME71785.1 hypothetical protein [Flammeovirga aprica JL-4]